MDPYLTDAPTLPPPKRSEEDDKLASALASTHEAMCTLTGMRRRWSFYCIYLDAYLDRAFSE